MVVNLKNLIESPSKDTEVWIFDLEGTITKKSFAEWCSRRDAKFLLETIGKIVKMIATNGRVNWSSMMMDIYSQLIKRNSSEEDIERASSYLASSPRKEICDLLKKLLEKGKVVYILTRCPQEVAKKTLEKMFPDYKGRIIVIGSTENHVLSGEDKVKIIRELVKDSGGCFVTDCKIDLTYEFPKSIKVFYIGPPKGDIGTKILDIFATKLSV